MDIEKPLRESLDQKLVNMKKIDETKTKYKAFRLAF